MFLTKVIAVRLYEYVCMCTVRKYVGLCLYWHFYYTRNVEVSSTFVRFAGHFA